MSSRLLACTLLLLASVNWAAAQSCCPAAGCTSKPADLPQNIAVDCVEHRAGVIVGQIAIVGTPHTPQGVILAQLPFTPGQLVSYPDLRTAEANLKKLNIFECDPDGTGIRPTVEILDPDGIVPVKDILVTVQEKCGAIFVSGRKDDETRTKCSCEDCTCCGCMNKPGAECSCKECKCCGCKTVDTNAASAACVSVIVPDGGTVLLAGLKFCIANNECSDECDCSKDECKCEKGKCKCASEECECCKEKCKCATEECACCEGECKCDKGECKCEQGKCKCDKGECKCEKDKCKCDKDKCKRRGKECSCDKCEECACDCCDGKCCCKNTKTSACPFCPYTLDACSMGWLVIEEICPVFRVWTMCPWMEAKVQDVLKPCMKSFTRQCKQILKAGKAAATNCPAEQGACEENGEPQAKKSCHGCGPCAEAGQKVRFWQFHVVPVSKVKQAAGFMIGWACGNAEKAKEGKCGCGAAKAVEPTKTTCPYLQKKEQQAKEKVKTADELFGELGSPLENLAKLEKARGLCKKADWLCEHGQYDCAVKCYEMAKELCPGSRWEVTACEGIKVAQAMKAMDEAVRTVTRELMEKLLEQVIHKSAGTTVEESEPVQTDPLPCQEPEAVRTYKERFADLLEQARSACAMGDLEMARSLATEAANLATPEVLDKVKALIDGARDCFANGCTADGWEMLHQALMLDPSSTEARDLQEQMILRDVQNRCDEFDCEQYDTLPPDDEDAEPCQPYDPDQPCDPCFDGCPGVGIKHRLPPVDAKLIDAMERVLIELRHPYDLLLPLSDGDCEDQEASFIIDVDEEEDLDIVPDECIPCDDEDSVDLKQQVRELMDIIREKVCVDVDCGKSQPGRARLWVQIGHVEYFVTFDAKGQPLVRVKVSAPEAEDIKTSQQTNIDETIRWIEAMNSGETATEGDSEETEEPLYQLETDLDPNW